VAPPVEGRAAAEARREDERDDAHDAEAAARLHGDEPERDHHEARAQQDEGQGPVARHAAPLGGAGGCGWVPTCADAPEPRGPGRADPVRRR
jgi:hypothetical protein